jgi:RNA polymerase sigma-70 factor (ECF subfamily)
MKKTKELSLQQTGLNFYASRNEIDFTKVYYRMKPGISVYLREMLPNMDDRNEVIATTFSKVWGKIHQYDPYWNFSTWVYRIALNEARLFFRGRKKTYSYEAMEESGINMEAKFGSCSIADHDDVNHVELLAQAVLSEINKLPTMYRTVLTLREVEKKKYEEIATELGWKENTVKTRIFKARRILRSEIEKKQPALLKMYQGSL